MDNLSRLFDTFQAGNESATPTVKDYNVFDFSYVPDKPLIRPETEEIAKRLLRYHQTTISRNLVIVGPRGSGKTVTLQYLAKRFAERGIQLPFYGINCRIHGTSFKILSEILGVRPRGYAFSELCTRFEQVVPSPAVIVLDEVEMLADRGARNDVLYFLSRSPKRYSVVLLTNNPRYAQTVDGSIRSSLQPEVIFFRNYSAPEILDILKDRAETGLHSVEAGLVEEIAAMTARNTNGDVRVAIKTLLYCATREAGTVAECFNKAREDVIKDVLVHANEKALLILKAAIEDPNKLVKSVYERYVGLSRGCHEEPYGYTQFHSNLGYLASLGLIMLVCAKVNRTLTSRIEPLVSEEEVNAVIVKRFQ